MTPRSCDDIKAYVQRALASRPTDPGSVHSPSPYWGYFVEQFAYLYDLSDAQLQRIRYHTYHLTGDNYQRYLFRNLNPAAIAARYRRLLPALEGFLPSEPPGGFGYSVDGALVTEDLIRYMEVLNDLLASGVFTRRAPPRVLEIGGGYGGLARLLASVNPSLSYVVCDLEETLFFQAVHLANTYGMDAIRLVEAEDNVGALMAPGRFVLVPQQRSDMLDGLRFDVAINQESLQEMTLEQVRHYLDLVSRTSTHFYSYNLDQHREYIIDETRIVTGLYTELNRFFPRKIWEATYRKRRGDSIRSPLRRLAHLLLGRYARLVTRSAADGRPPNRVYRCVFEC